MKYIENYVNLECLFATHFGSEPKQQPADVLQFLEEIFVVKKKAEEDNFDWISMFDDITIVVMTRGGATANISEVVVLSTEVATEFIRVYGWRKTKQEDGAIAPTIADATSKGGVIHQNKEEKCESEPSTAIPSESVDKIANIGDSDVDLAKKVDGVEANNNYVCKLNWESVFEGRMRKCALSFTDEEYFSHLLLANSTFWHIYKEVDNDDIISTSNAIFGGGVDYWCGPVLAQQFEDSTSLCRNDSTTKRVLDVYLSRCGDEYSASDIVYVHVTGSCNGIGDEREDDLVDLVDKMVIG